MSSCTVRDPRRRAGLGGRAPSGEGLGRRGGDRAGRARRHDDPGRRRHGRTPAAAERVRAAAHRDAGGRRPDGRPGAPRRRAPRRCSRNRGSSEDAGPGRAGVDRRSSRPSGERTAGCRRSRGISVSVAGGAPGAVLGAFLGRLASAPFLRPVRRAPTWWRRSRRPRHRASSRLRDRALLLHLRRRHVKHARRDLLALPIDARRVHASARSARSLRSLYAESAVYLGDEAAGRAWIDHVDAW